MALPINQIICGDCLEILKDFPDNSVDLVLTDPPYGTTACKWDAIIPFEPMWEHLKRLIKPNSAIVLTAGQPFTSALIMSNTDMFKYCWVWKKTKATGFLDAKKRPLNDYEDICVFYNSQPPYNPQMTKAKKLYQRGFVQRKQTDCYGKEKDFDQVDTGHRYPKRVIEICNADTKDIVHPTQKPVALMQYLIKTYSNKNDLVLDFTCGSGTTCVAAEMLGRKWLGIDISEEYCQIARDRIKAVRTGVPVAEQRKGQKGLFE